MKKNLFIISNMNLQLLRMELLVVLLDAENLGDNTTRDKASELMILSQTWKIHTASNG